MAKSGERKIIDSVIEFVKYGENQLTENEKIDIILKENNISEEDIIKGAENIKNIIETQIKKYHKTLNLNQKDITTRIKEIARKILGGNMGTKEINNLNLEPKLAKAFFRNLKGVSPKDKNSMIEDIKLLNELEKIYKKNK